MPGRLPLPCIPALRARGLVDRVLENAGDRAIVFGRDEQQGLGALDFVLQPENGLGPVLVVVLVLERQIIEPRDLEHEFRRRQLHDGSCRLQVE